MNQQNNLHQPVLPKEVLQYLQPGQRDSYLDVTAGYGGHAKMILESTKSPQKAVLVDRDDEAAHALRVLFAKQGARIIHQDFLAACKQLREQAMRFDMILADLGVSSPHLENNNRGFSLKGSGPLDMRMDRRQQLTAEHIVNNASEAELEHIFGQYGEEPKARQIAREIVAVRPLKTTGQLVAIAAKAWPVKSRRHPATRIFQALRIAVNDELNQLAAALPIWFDLLASGGRLAVISFHSLEDRIVKQFMSENSADRYDGQLQILTKKPVVATKDEIDYNPRARSAKLRAAVKIKTKRKG